MEALVERTSDALGQLSPFLRSTFDALDAFRDLETRPNKAPGGFMLQFDLERRPFIFSNSEGVHQDIITLLHESGHAFHTVLGAERSPVAGMRPPIEFAEVASMAMELLPLPYIDAFYPDPA